MTATASEPAKLDLDSVDVVHLTTVLEDCVDQLVVLGRIMPASYDAHPGAEKMVADEIRELLQQQKQIENKYEQVSEDDLYLQSRSVLCKQRKHSREDINI